MRGDYDFSASPPCALTRMKHDGGILENKSSKTAGFTGSKWASVQRRKERDLPVYLKLSRMLPGGKDRDANGRRRFQSTSQILSRKSVAGSECSVCSVCVYPPPTTPLTSRHRFGGCAQHVVSPHFRNTFNYEVFESSPMGAMEIRRLALTPEQHPCSPNTGIFLWLSLTCI